MLACAAPLAAQDGTLRGSREKMERQHGAAESNDFPFLQTPADVEQFAQLGVLVPVQPNSELKLSKVSFAVTRPEVRTFVRRLAHQYRGVCGQPLVVTSLTRPLDEQPENASELSVHPAGMAVDIGRVSGRKCRRWMERTLLSLQDQGVLDATKERHPAHYHVAVYLDRYAAYIAQLGDDQPDVAPADVTATPPRSRLAVREAAHRAVYRVQRGDTLGEIAERHGVSLTRLKRVNGLRSSRIAPGQVLRIPLSS